MVQCLYNGLIPRDLTHATIEEVHLFLFGLRHLARTTNRKTQSRMIWLLVSKQLMQQPTEM